MKTKNPEDWGMDEFTYVAIGLALFDSLLEQVVALGVAQKVATPAEEAIVAQARNQVKYGVHLLLNNRQISRETLTENMLAPANSVRREVVDLLVAEQENNQNASAPGDTHETVH
jgi:hypothetical protein